MAENKKGFLLYADQYEVFKQLPDDKAGQLIKHIFSYVNDEEPQTDDLILNLVFTPIKQQLKRDLEKFEGTKKDRSNSGQLGNLKRYYPAIYKKVLGKKITLQEGCELAKLAKRQKESQQLANVAVNDSVNVTVKVNETDNDSLLKEKNTKKKSGFSFRKSLCELGLKEELADDFLKNRKLKRLANTQTAFKQLKIEINKTGAEINELMTFVISKGWGSLKNSWIEKENKKFQTEGKSKMKTHFEANEGAKKILGI